MSYVLPPQYSTRAFSEALPKNSGVYVTLSPQGNTHMIYLPALQCILSEYCARETKELTRTVSVTQSFPSINKPTFSMPISKYLSTARGFAVSMKELRYWNALLWEVGHMHWNCQHCHASWAMITSTVYMAMVLLLSEII